MIKIAITSRTETLHEQTRTFVNTTYLNALKPLGAEVFILPDICKDYTEIANFFDGLIVTGGTDVNPLLYHQENRNSLGINEIEDHNDILLIRAFHQSKKPILGICRGLQIINVAFGGSLIQDIPSEYRADINHVNKEEGHSIIFTASSKLKEIMSGYTHVNSYHHQAIENLADGFIVSAKAPDGIIEAIENESILAVQWHPERMIAQKQHQAIFTYFIDRCSK